MTSMHKNTMVFGQLTVVTGVYWCSTAMPRGTTVTTGAATNKEFLLELQRKGNLYVMLCALLLTCTVLLPCAVLRPSDQLGPGGPKLCAVATVVQWKRQPWPHGMNSKKETIRRKTNTGTMPTPSILVLQRVY